MTFQIPPIHNGLSSRRSLLKWGMMGVGAAALATVPTTVLARSSRYLKPLTFTADDIGILNFALLLEELEATFYVLALRSGKVTDRTEYEYLRAIGRHEATHVTFLRKVLGSNAMFKSRELNYSSAGFRAVLKDRDTILNTAVMLEDTGVHAYNGAGPSLKDPTYILAAGSIVSVEARHSAGVRGLLRRPVTQKPSEDSIPKENLIPELNPFNGRAYDELYSPKQIVSIVSSLNILNNPVNGALVA
jgi:Ferritin-like domain